MLGLLLLGGCACGGSQAPVLEVPVGAENDAIELAAYEESIGDLGLELQASLEEPPDPEVDCESVCGLRYRICDLSERICEISARHPTWDRPAEQCFDSQLRCSGAEEDTDRVCDCEPYQPDVPA